MANLKRTALTGSMTFVGLLGVAILSFPAAGVADNRRNDSNSYYDYARVTHVQPVTRIVQVSTPHEVCWNERVRTVSDNGRRGRRRDREFAPTVLGGIIGGVVGNQFGGGRGNKAMTVAGALLGASIGRDASVRNHQNYGRPARVSYTTERRCEVEQVTHEEERIDGYRVSYRFRGRDYVTRMNTDPGDQIRVRVEVDPV